MESARKIFNFNQIAKNHGVLPKIYRKNLYKIKEKGSKQIALRCKYSSLSPITFLQF